MKVIDNREGEKVTEGRGNERQVLKKLVQLQMVKNMTGAGKMKARDRSSKKEETFQ